MYRRYHKNHNLTLWFESTPSNWGAVSLSSLLCSCAREFVGGITRHCPCPGTGFCLGCAHSSICSPHAYTGHTWPYSTTGICSYSCSWPQFAFLPPAAHTQCTSAHSCVAPTWMCCGCSADTHDPLCHRCPGWHCGYSSLEIPLKRSARPLH